MIWAFVVLLIFVSPAFMLAVLSKEEKKQLAKDLLITFIIALAVDIFTNFPN